MIYILKLLKSINMKMNNTEYQLSTGDSVVLIIFIPNTGFVCCSRFKIAVD